MSASKPPPDEADLLEASGYAATLSRNDPDYYAGLEETARDVAEIANEVSAVRLIEGKGGAHIEVGLQRARNRPASRRTAFALGRILEAPVVVEDKPRAGHTHADASYHQPPAYTFIKDDRK